MIEYVCREFYNKNFIPVIQPFEMGETTDRTAKICIGL